ncbi:telomere length regulator protein [Pseudozyma hubeiensis SY62]|uniref:Telomere length regulator protein n=1 Tax=Pseudozyma hubeiensis (strain SY62) TaxID=1305764 RepID=R9PKH0_PSEHS|nr:telomere length regulator protein [Pseudozyma hubeiensis SY62]GAC98625.1 telomere length regulator protein [Pseudozyma hubeiensis SY62]
MAERQNHPSHMPASKRHLVWHTDRLRLDNAGSFLEPSTVYNTVCGRRDDLQPDGAWIARCRSQDFQGAVGTSDDPECQMIVDAARGREASEGSSAFEPAAEAQQTNDTEMPQCELR